VQGNPADEESAQDEEPPLDEPSVEESSAVDDPTNGTGISS